MKLGQDVDAQHTLKNKYFDSMYNRMKKNIEGLKNEAHIDFVLDKNVHLDCCNFLRCNEFGSIIPNIPKPSIKNIAYSFVVCNCAYITLIVDRIVYYCDLYT